MSLDPDVQAVFGAPSQPPPSDPDVAAAFKTADITDSAADTPAFQYLHSTLSGMGQNIGASAKLAKDVVQGKIKSIADADTDVKAYQAQNPAYQPQSAGGKAVAAVMGSNYNPINWPGLVLKGAGEGTTALLDTAGVPSQVSTIVGPAAEAASDVALGAAGATRALGLGKASPVSSVAPEASATAQQPLSASSGARTPYFEPQDIPGTKLTVDNEPVEGGIPDSAQEARGQILARVGLPNARQSALTGNAADAATDFQLSKFDEPAGQAAKAQFELERSTLADKADSIVKSTGGTLGSDEDTLSARGQTIAAPFDALRDYFDQQHAANYAAAGEKAAGAPVGQMEGVQALLKDPDFTETLLAKDQGGLLGSMQRQFERFQQINPQGFTAETAENFRKWLNQVWTPDNSATIGKVKGALDDDVMKGAGEDIYGPARQLAQTEHQVFGSSGIQKLTDANPNNPLNRSTPYEKIPDTLARLSAAQFDNVVRTLQSLPDELQPQAQAALGEIKAHLANKVADAGKSTQGQWNSPAVSKVIAANSAKLQSAFEDQPQALSDLQDLNSAGKILKVNQSYPGAAAQAANALKRGMMSKALTHLAGAAGAGIGAGSGIPFAAPAAAALGEAVGSRVGGSMAEKAALRNWGSRTTPLSSLMQKSGAGTTP